MVQQHFLPFNIELARIAQGYDYLAFTYLDHYLATIDMDNLHYFKDKATLNKFIASNPTYYQATL